MAIEERLAAQQAKLVGNTPQGRAAVAARTSGPVQMQPFTASDGTVVDPEALEEQLRAKHEAEAQALRDNASFPSVEAAQKAAQLLQDNANVWPQERLDAGWKRVKNFVAQNPEAVEAFQADKAQQEWEAEFIDTTPQASSRLRKAQNEALKSRLTVEDDTFAGQKFARDLFPIPKTVDELDKIDPDSRLGVLEAEEAKGLDTTSGFGGLGDQVSAAAEFNSPRARAGWLYANALDKIEQAGIELPEGIQPVQLNEELGQLEYLNPTEDGKLRRTLVEGEFFRMADVGQAADLPELFSMITATAASLHPFAGRHPLAAEFAGDVVGRNLGIMAEFLLSNNEISQEELQNAMQGSLSDSAVATALSRTTARGIQALSNRGAIRATGRDEGRAAEQATEAADVMEAVNDINKGTDAPGFTLERGSLSKREAQIARGREKTLSKNAADAIEAERLNRLESLRRANERVAVNANAAPGPTDPANVLELQQRMNTLGDLQVHAPKRVAPNVDRHKYTFGGEEDATSVGPGARLGDAGVEMFVDHDKGVAVIENVFAGQNFGGRTVELLERALDDVPSEYAVRSSGSVTKQGQKFMDRLNDSGYKIVERSDTYTDPISGEKLNFEGGVFEIVARPGEIQAPDAVMRARFSQSSLEQDLDEVLDSVPALQQMTNESQAYLHGVIGWSPQRVTSKYSVENKSSSGVSQTVRRIQNRIARTLTGTEASQANRVLNAAVRQDADDEGTTFLTGLAAEELDLGNLINAREAVAQVALKTGDQDMIRLVRDVDNLLKNAPIFTEKGNRIAASTRGNIYSALTDWRETTRLLDGQVAKVNANQMFAQSDDGTFLNSSLKNLRLILGNNSRYIKHMKPVIDGSPAIQQHAQDALNSIYKADVLEKGWTRARHDAFLRRYGDAASDIMHPEDLQVLADIRPPSGGMGRLQRISQAAKRRWDTLTERMGKFDINPDNVLGSLQVAPPERVRTFMRYADRLQPKLAKQLRADMAAQIRNDLDRGFFDTDRGLDKLGSGFKLKDWWESGNGARQRTIRSIMGEQYAKDLGNIVEAAAIDAKRTAVRGHRPETQGDIIRVTRSLLGPLSRPQRQITALSYVRQRALARKVLNVMSDPEQLRLLNEAGRLPARSRAGVAALTRLGIFEAAGVEDPENNPEGVQEFYNYIEETTQAGLEDNE